MCVRVWNRVVRTVVRRLLVVAANHRADVEEESPRQDHAQLAKINKPVNKNIYNSFYILKSQ
jgi:hypothetical protein